MAEDIHNRIEAALDSIRDYLQTDGGDVRLVSVSDDLIVELELLGACASCSMSEMTMTAGIEQAIRKAVPEVREVRTVEAAKTDS
jgi:Fe-S cluster biogenesis protein NfuA